MTLTSRRVAAHFSFSVGATCQTPRQVPSTAALDKRPSAGTDPPGEVGALLLCVYDDAEELRYAGSVGTGWSSPTGGDLMKRLVATDA